MERTMMNDGFSDEYKERADEVNTDRVEKTKKRVAEAICILSNPISCLNEGRIIHDADKDISKAVNLIESAEEELRWACNYFNWDCDICYQLNEACYEFGRVIAGIIADEKEDAGLLGIYGTNGMSSLGKALATLVRWFDEEE